jgi:glycerophosphoryl diester phosphodiesterase
MLVPLLRQLDWLIARPIAHRGLHDSTSGIIENTMAAFAAAISQNYAIECDLQISSDGEAMVFHDSRLERLTEAKGRVIELSSGELKRVSMRNTKEVIPTLDELLRQVSGRVPLIIEIKSRWNGNNALVRRALDVLAPYQGPYALMSFDPDVLEAMRQLSPQTVRGIVADRVADGLWRQLPLPRRLELRHFAHVERSLPHFVSFEAKGLPWPPVRALRAAGLPVISWTVRSQSEAREARRYSDQITFEGIRP